MEAKSVVMIGKTVPEPTNERVEHYVCSAGLSLEAEDEFQLVRLYPLGLRSAAPRWSLDAYHVERHPGNKDSRPETWRPTGAFHIGDLPRDDGKSILKRFIVSGLLEANARRMSLAVVRPVSPRVILAATDAGEPTYLLFGDDRMALKTKERFEYVPRLKFDTEDGKEHNLQLREWGLYELLRKNQAKLSGMTVKQRTRYVEVALRLTDDSLLLIGNYANHRSSWLVIASL